MLVREGAPYPISIAVGLSSPGSLAVWQFVWLMLVSDHEGHLRCSWLCIACTLVTARICSFPQSSIHSAMFVIALCICHV